MKISPWHSALTVLLLLNLCAVTQLQAQGTAFNYQGRLDLNGAPASGSYDLRFTIYDAPTIGNVASGPLTNSSVNVSNGLFATSLDFGAGVFTGPGRWLRIEVRTNGVGSFALLSPRQPLTATPYAIHAGNASNVVNGTVVKSLNNLRDNIVLAAGVNVTLATNGNTLTISGGKYLEPQWSECLLQHGQCGHWNHHTQSPVENQWRARMDRPRLERLDEDNGTIKYLIVNPPNGNRFFRLFKP